METTTASPTGNIPAFEPTLTVNALADYLSADEALGALEVDAAWTPDELAYCLRDAARTYNGLLPRVYPVTPDRLPTDTDLFFIGAAAHAYRRLAQKLQRHDYAVQAGGVSHNLVANQLAHAQKQHADLLSRFTEQATQYKRMLNIAGFTRKIG